ncbi:MAG: selenide, water dikinase SelD [Burkholderiales bacterium]|nr:selenide, water dikinase SelD [Burkholderiales bacterium]
MNKPLESGVIRLTELSHGGGCGCKLAPAVLNEILAGSPAGKMFPDLLVGTESSDDAAVYRISDTQAVIATTDFFMPIVDDPHDFGRIAATNAVSDVYAMGGRPFLALALLGMPVGKLPVETIRRIVAGGQSVCDAAGIPIAGGHSIDSQEPIYGLAVLGLVHPDKVKRNDRAHAGDVLILGKGLGVGIMSAALKKGELRDEAYRRMIESTTRLNTPGIALSDMAGVHALTDVTGFGLLGHLLEICRGSGLAAQLEWSKVPLLGGVRELLEQGFVTGASDRNWNSYGAQVALPAGDAVLQRKLLTDPQTSGGLLVACAPETAPAVLETFRAEGFADAAVIGRLEAGTPAVSVI